MKEPQQHVKLRASWTIYLSSKWIISHGFQEQTQKKSFEVPLLAFTVRMPCDGLPMLEDWLTHAASIWAIGYEPWREAVEIKPTSQTVLGNHMGFADVEPTKGVGRISMLLFTVWYSYLKLKDVLLSPPGREEFTKHLGKGILIGVDFLLGVPGFSSWFWYTWGYSCIAFEVSMFPNFQGWCSRWERRPWCEGPIFNQATGWPSVWECRPWCWPNITNEWPFLWECRPWCWPNINKDTKGWPFLWECRPWCWPNINKDTKGWPFLRECRPRCWPCQTGTWRRVTFSTAASSLENQEHRKPKGDATIQNLRFDHILHNLVLDPTKDGSSSFFFLWDHVLALPNLLGHHLNSAYIKPNPLISQSQVAEEIEDGPLCLPPWDLREWLHVEANPGIPTASWTPEEVVAAVVHDVSSKGSWSSTGLGFSIR